MSIPKYAIFIELKTNGESILYLIPKLKSLWNLYSPQYFSLGNIKKLSLLVMAEVHTHIIQKSHKHTISKFKYKNSNDNELEVCLDIVTNTRVNHFNPHRKLVS